MSLPPLGRYGPLLALLMACGSKSARVDAAVEHAVAASAYDRACADVADCVGIYEGALGCCPPECPNAAIREDDLAAYKRDLNERSPVCVPTPPCVPPKSCDGRIACVDGTCALLRPDAGP